MSRREMHILSPRIWVKHFSLLPVVGITVGAVALATSYVTYMCLTKPDMSFRPHSWLDNAPYKKVKPTECRKLMAYSKDIEINEELVALRKEIGSYKA